VQEKIIIYSQANHIQLFSFMYSIEMQAFPPTEFDYVAAAKVTELELQLQASKEALEKAASELKSCKDG
jgi:hypothetical protein